MAVPVALTEAKGSLSVQRGGGKGGINHVIKLSPRASPNNPTHTQKEYRGIEESTFDRSIDFFHLFLLYSHVLPDFSGSLKKKLSIWATVQGNGEDFLITSYSTSAFQLRIQ